MRILVCGSRDWDHEFVIEGVLDGILYGLRSERVLGDELIVIEGGARGADNCAAAWADDRGFHVHDFPVIHKQFSADWNRYGKAAGSIRNQQMLDEGRPEVVWAFHDNLSESKGTADMVRRAKAVGIPVYVVSRA